MAASVGKWGGAAPGGGPSIRWEGGRYYVITGGRTVQLCRSKDLGERDHLSSCLRWAASPPTTLCSRPEGQVAVQADGLAHRAWRRARPRGRRNRTLRRVREGRSPEGFRRDVQKHRRVGCASLHGSVGFVLRSVTARVRRLEQQRRGRLLLRRQRGRLPRLGRLDARGAVQAAVRLAVLHKRDRFFEQHAAGAAGGLLLARSS